MRASIFIALALLVGCSESHSSDDGGAHDAGARVDASTDAGPPCAFIESVDRTCLGDEACVVAVHQVNCCGSEIATGIDRGERERFDALEALCVESYPGCGCAAGPTMTDSGEIVTDLASVQVGCILRGTGGVCMTYVAMRPPDGR